MGDDAKQAGGNDSATQPGDKWGDSISEARQAELRALFERQEEWVAQPEATRGDSVFKGVRLTGADVFWLAEWSGRGSLGEVPNLHLEGASLEEAHLEGANLMSVHLEGATIPMAHLEAAFLAGAHLQDASLWDAYLERVSLWGAHLERADLRKAHLEGADFSGARIEDANLFGASMEGTVLWGAHLEGAILAKVSLAGRRMAEADLARIHRWQQEGATNYLPAVLRPADLCRAFFDHATDLEDAKLGDPELGCVSVADTRWGGVNLAVVTWPQRPVLGDEREARERKCAPSRSANEHGSHLTKTKQREVQREQHAERLTLYRAATRANRQLATVLRTQGLNDEADHFAYRAQMLQRTVLRLQRRWAAAFGSWLLDAVSGYGYRPVRSVIAYVAIILFFAALYLINGQFAAPHLRWDEALVLSISSFHGRGFFTSGISLGDTLARLAAGEAIIGLLIEITFIATFTQRFFAR